MTHTPTPWRLELGYYLLGEGEEPYINGVSGPDGHTIRLTGFALSGGQECEDNTRFIVEAVNSYEALRAKLALAEKALERTLNHALVRIPGDLEATIRAALAAIREGRE